jgi:hypothetical protein
LINQFDFCFDFQVGEAPKTIKRPAAKTKAEKSSKKPKAAEEPVAAAS